MSELWTQFDINATFCEISPRTLLNWVQTGLIGYERSTKDRRGICRLYNRTNVFQFALVNALTKMKLPTSLIKKIIINHFKGDVKNYRDKFLLIRLKNTDRRSEDIKFTSFFVDDSIEEDHLRDSKNQYYLTLIIPLWEFDIFGPLE